MNGDYEDFKSRSESDYRTILGVAKRGLAAPKLDHDDRDSLERAIYFLEKSFRVLGRIADQSNEGKLAWQALCEMMGAVFLVGSAGTYTGSAVLHFHADHTAPARDKKQPVDDARISDLAVAIIGEAAYLDKILACSLKCAGVLRPGVREHFGLSREGDGWPSDSTIKQIILRIKTVKTDRVSR
jgi:hypothetical protein